MKKLQIVIIIYLVIIAIVIGVSIYYNLNGKRELLITTYRLGWSQGANAMHKTQNEKIHYSLEEYFFNDSIEFAELISNN